MWRKLRTTVAQFGLVKATLYGLHRLLQRTGGRSGVFCYDLVAQPVGDASLLDPKRGRSVAVREIVAGDAALAQLPLTADVLSHRFRQNVLCLGAFQHDRLIGCLWLCLGPFREDEVRCRFVPVPAGHAAWDFDVFVDPQHRVGICLARLWEEANRRLRARGVAWSMSRISVFNPRSLAAHRRLGARRLGRAVFVRIGPIQMTAATVSPYLHLSWSNGVLPELVLRSPPSAAPGSPGK